MLAALLAVTLSFTLPSHSADTRGSMRCQEVPFISAGDLRDVRAYAVRASVFWNNLTTAWATCKTRRDSTETFHLWWPMVKEDAEPHLVRIKDERGRAGQGDTLAVSFPGALRYFVTTTDTLGHESCRSGMVGQ